MGKSIEGIKHYNKLIDELLANDIEPFVTLFHWDLPNALEEEYMGFLSSKIVDDFVNYADICFWEFGDRVKNWVTLNEPHMFTTRGYVQGQWAPGRGGENEDGDPQTEPYTVAYNLLNCHAGAYRKYSEDYKDTQKGKVGITLNCTYFQPYRGPNYQQDVQAVKYAYDFVVGWFLEPLTSGTWPENMEKFATTPTPNHPNGRVLPKFSTEQSKKLIGSYDFLGVNYYTASYAQYQGPSDEIPLGYSTDSHYVGSGQDSKGKDIGEPSYQGSWIYLCPQQLTELLIYIKQTYNVTKDMIITENGSSDRNESGKTYEQVRDDVYRINYIKEHLKAISLARQNNVKVMGYFVWSFMDSFEWDGGYGSRFGMIYVDFMNGLQRYPKKSAIWFKNFLVSLIKPKKYQQVKRRQIAEANHKVSKSGELSQELQNIHDRILARIGPVAYKLKLPQELQNVHDTFHVSNLTKCLTDTTLIVPLEEIQVNEKLNFVEEPVEIMDREVKRLKQSRIPIVKVRWSAKRGPEFTWERDDQMKLKYPHLFANSNETSIS
ncbi:hypothetical protein LXL04_022676 [Taraxacum kok-saghyz]